MIVWLVLLRTLKERSIAVLLWQVVREGVLLGGREQRRGGGEVLEVVMSAAVGLGYVCVS